MRHLRGLLLLPILLVLFQLGGNPVFANSFFQDQEKGMKAEEYVKKRPKATGTGSPARKRVYRNTRNPSTPVKPIKPTKIFEPADIGFTFWRFGQITENDEATKSLKEVDPRTNKPVVARRIGSETLLAVGDLIRLGIESGTHEGYMYVINREKYLDGTYGAATLLFPTLSRWRGNNLVQPGILLYFPSAQTNFVIAMDSERKQVAEELIIIVSPTELVDPMRIKAGPIEISNEQVDDWLKKWRVETDQIELEGGVGETMTAAERAPSDEQKSLKVAPSLTQEDAVPQTIYRMKIRRGNPVLATIELKIKP